MVLSKAFPSPRLHSLSPSSIHSHMFMNPLLCVMLEWQIKGGGGGGAHWDERAGNGRPFLLAKSQPVD